VVKRQGRAVSEVCRRFEPLPQLLRNVRYKTGKPLESLHVQKAITAATARLNGSGRVLVRPSGTEPVIRVMAEGDDPIAVEQIVDEIVGALTEAAA
jgi:phosphoglucosamine mutase